MTETKKNGNGVISIKMAAFILTIIATVATGCIYVGGIAGRVSVCEAKDDLLIQRMDTQEALLREILLRLP